MFQSRSLSNKIYLRESIFGFRMDHAKSLEANLDEILKMTIKLANSDNKEELNDKNKSIIILNFLSKAYRVVKSAIKYGRLLIIIDEMISALKSKDLEIKIDKNIFGDGKNHMVCGQQQRKNTNGSNLKPKIHDKASTKNKK